MEHITAFDSLHKLILEGAYQSLIDSRVDFGMIPPDAGKDPVADISKLSSLGVHDTVIPYLTPYPFHTARAMLHSMRTEYEDALMRALVNDGADPEEAQAEVLDQSDDYDDDELTVYGDWRMPDDADMYRCSLPMPCGRNAAMWSLMNDEGISVCELMWVRKYVEYSAKGAVELDHSLHHIFDRADGPFDRTESDDVLRWYRNDPLDIFLLSDDIPGAAMVESVPNDPEHVWLFVYCSKDEMSEALTGWKKLSERTLKAAM